MGNLIVSLLAATIAVHAGGREGIERTTRAHEAYVAGRFAEAVEGYRAALEAFGNEPSLPRAITLENLGVALRAQGEFAKARLLMESAIAQIAELAGPNSPETLRARSNLAVLYWSAGEFARAEEAALQAGDQRTLASAYIGQHRFAEATQLLRSLLESADERSAVILYSNLSAAALGAGDTVGAEQYARHSVDLANRVLPETHPMRATGINNLAQTCRFNGKFFEAESYYREALALWESTLGPAHPDYARGLMNLAAFYHERGREAGAEQLYLRAIAILERPDPILQQIARNELADVLRAELRYTEATRLAKSSLARLETTLSPADPRLIHAQQNWSRLTADTHAIASARKPGR